MEAYEKEGEITFEDTLYFLEEEFQELNLNQLNVVERVLNRVKKEKKKMMLKKHMPPATKATKEPVYLEVVGSFNNVPPANLVPDGALNLGSILSQMVAVPAQNKNNKKGNTMYRDHDSYTPSLATLEIDKREHLLVRLEQIRDKKQTLLREKFGMNDPKGPQTFGELKKFIEEGRLQVNEKYAKKFKDEVELDRWTNPFSYLTFVDPSIKRDEKGFEEALKALSDSHAATMDMIVIHDPIAGHEALKSFESQQF